MNNDLALKPYYANLDSVSVRQVPQPLQHQAIAQYADQLGGKVIYYIMEEWYTIRTQEVLRQKSEEKPDVVGFIFFRISQFYQQGKPKVSLLKKLILQGYELHFVRERISIKNLQDLEEQIPIFIASSYVEQRDRSPDSFPEFSKMIGEAKLSL